MFKVSAQLRQTYVKNRSEDLGLLKRSFEKGSVDEFHRIGHQLTGNAENYGFPDLVGLGERMESLTEDRLNEEGPALLGEFKMWLESASATDSHPLD